MPNTTTGPSELGGGSEEELTPEQSEAQMRRALETLSSNAPARPASAPSQPFGRSPGKKTGAFSPTGPRKHRFVQDGEVQVVHLSLQKERPRETTPPPDAEQRTARERGERVLQEAQSMIRGLQTKLAHAEIALSEAVQRANAQAESAGAARVELQEARAEARAADQARLVLEQRLLDQRAALEAEIAALRLEAEQARAQPPVPVEPARKQPEKVARKPREKRVASPDKEQQPVKWWLTTKAKPVRAKRNSGLD